MLKSVSGGAPRAGSSVDVADTGSNDEYLTMSEDLRAALFPKTPQMVSEIFDRPPPLDRSRGYSSPASQGTRSAAFPVIF
jgi:hypothetical protein